MSALAKSKMSVEEFLAWAETQPDGKFELVDGVPVAMSPERIRHSDAKGDGFVAFRNAIAKEKAHCRVWVDGPSVRIGKHRTRVPDIVVQCGEWDADSQIAENPIIVVEVISPSSKRVDQSDKLDEYFGVPSIQHYLIVKPEKRVVVHHARGDGGNVLTRIFTSGAIELTPPGLTVNCEDLLGPAN